MSNNTLGGNPGPTKPNQPTLGGGSTSATEPPTPNLGGKPITGPGSKGKLVVALVVIAIVVIAVGAFVAIR